MPSLTTSATFLTQCSKNNRFFNISILLCTDHRTVDYHPELHFLVKANVCDKACWPIAHSSYNQKRVTHVFNESALQVSKFPLFQASPKTSNIQISSSSCQPARRPGKRRSSWCKSLMSRQKRDPSTSSCKGQSLLTNLPMN